MRSRWPFSRSPCTFFSLNIPRCDETKILPKATNFVCLLIHFSNRGAVTYTFTVHLVNIPSRLTPPPNAHAENNPHLCYSVGQAGYATSLHKQCPRTSTAECGFRYRQFSALRLPSSPDTVEDTPRQAVLCAPEGTSSAGVAWIRLDPRRLRKRIHIPGRLVVLRRPEAFWVPSITRRNWSARTHIIGRNGAGAIGWDFWCTNFYVVWPTPTQVPLRAAQTSLNIWK